MPINDTDAVTLLVRQLERLVDLSADERDALRALPSETVSYRAGERIVRSSELRSTCFLVLEGFVSSSKETGSGRRQITSFFIPGDLPDLPALHLKVVDGDLRALTSCQVAVLKHLDLLPLTRAYPTIAEALWRYSLVVSSIFHEWVVNVGARPAICRLAHLLCEMTARLEAMGLARDGRCELPISQALLAEATGLSRIHVNRSLKALKDEGLITLGFNRLVIHDWENLARAGEFDSGYLPFLQPHGWAA